MKKLFLFLLPLTMFAADLVKEVRHELVMLPYYNVFDNLSYRVDGSKVTLFGQVRQPKLKSDAEKAVKSIEGVTAIDNQIEVMPLSASDDQVARSVSIDLLQAHTAALPVRLRAADPYHRQER